MKLQLPSFLRKKETNAMTVEKALRVLPILIGQQGEQPRAMDSRYKEYLSIYGDAEIASVWVFACVKAIAQTFATLNLKFYETRRKADGKSEDVELPDNHPLVQLFWSINPVMSRYDFWEATLTYLELTGEFFWALEDMIGNMPREIWPLRPDRIQVVPDKKEMIGGYIYTAGAGRAAYLPDEMLHGKYINPLNEFRGLSPLGAARQGVISDYYAVKANQKFFKQGMRASGAFKTQQPLGEDSFNRLRAQLSELYAGVNNFHRNLLLENGLEWQDMTINAKDMEFIQQRKFSREEILAVYKVPPVKVGIFEYANYANSKEQDNIYWSECIIPRLMKIEEHANTFLTPRYGNNIYGKFDLSKVAALRENEDLKSKIAVRLVKDGLWTHNEARSRFWNMEGVKWGDVWYAPFSLSPVTEQRNNGNNGNGNGKSVSNKQTLPACCQSSTSDSSRADLPDNPELDRKWRTFIRFITPRERKFEKLMIKLFKEQAGRVLEKFDDATKAFKSETRNPKSEIKKDFNPSILLAMIFDEEAERLTFIKGTQGSIFEIVKEAGEHSALALGASFDVEDPRVIELIANKTFKFSSRASRTTQDDIRASLIEGTEAGETIEEIRKRISLDVFDHAENVRATRIARTEVVGASNGAATESYRQAGVEKKHWLTARDERVRGTHVQAEIDYGPDIGTAIGIDEKFKIGSSFLLYPGDPDGSPEEIINERCTLLPVVE